MPNLQLRSNGLCHFKIAALSRATSCVDDLAVSSWSEYLTLNAGGTRGHVRGVAAPSGLTGSQRSMLPTGKRGRDFHHGRALVWSRNQDLATRSESDVPCWQASEGEQNFFDKIHQQIESRPGSGRISKPGSIFVIDDEFLDDGDRLLLPSIARIVVTESEKLTAQLAHRSGNARPTAGDVPAVTPTPMAGSHASSGDLLAFNGHSGFTSEWRESSPPLRRST